MVRMRSVTPNEVRDSITYVPSDSATPEINEDVDAEMAWEAWGEALEKSETQGTVRISKIPMDEQGNPQGNSKSQIQLASVPFDQYDYDALLAFIRTRFMKPGELIAVRLMGFTDGTRGVRFNRIITLQREAGDDKGGQSNLGEVITLMQQSQNAQAQMLREILTPVAQAPKTQTESLVETILKVGPIFMPLLVAWMERPKQSSDLKGMIEAMISLQELRGERVDSSDGTMDLISKVAVPGLKLLGELAASKNQQAQTLPVRRAPRLPPPAIKETTENLAGVDMATLTQIKEQLKELATLAPNTEPREAAELIMSMMPPEMDEQLYSVVSNKVAFKVLLEQCPEAYAQKEWFEQLRLAILHEYENPDDVKAERPSLVPN